MITGWRYVTSDVVPLKGFQQINRHGSLLSYNSVLIDNKSTYVIVAKDIHVDKISELVKFKFDYDISKMCSLSFIWCSFEAHCSKISVCDDIEKDSARFYYLSEYLLKGVK